MTQRLLNTREHRQTNFFLNVFSATNNVDGQMGAGLPRGLLMALTYLTYTPRGTKNVVLLLKHSTLRADLNKHLGSLRKTTTALKGTLFRKNIPTV